MRKLQGKWVLVPHGELKLIICDNLSASENSNTSTKLCEPQKGVEKKRMIKEKGKEKRKGQLKTRKKRLPEGWTVNVFRRVWFDKLDLNVQYGHIIFQIFRLFCIWSELILFKWYIWSLDSILKEDTHTVALISPREFDYQFHFYVFAIKIEW